MIALRRVVSLMLLAGGLAGCVVYPDGTVAPVAAVPPPATTVAIGVGPAWGGYYRPWGGYYRPWWGGYYYRPWRGYYRPYPYRRW